LRLGDRRRILFGADALNMNHILTELRGLWRCWLSGHRDIDGIFAGTDGDSYSTWNIGGTYSNWSLGFDLRYIGTSIDSEDPIVTSAFTTEQKADHRIIFSIKKSHGPGK
jgi:hypothetical protein